MTADVMMKLSKCLFFQCLTTTPSWWQTNKQPAFLTGNIGHFILPHSQSFKISLPYQGTHQSVYLCTSGPSFQCVYRVASPAVTVLVNGIEYTYKSTH